MLLLEKVEILLKMNRLATEEVQMETVNVAKQAFEMSIRIYGKTSIIKNHTLLTYALALSKVKQKQDEGLQLFKKAEENFVAMNKDI